MQKWEYLRWQMIRKSHHKLKKKWWTLIHSYLKMEIVKFVIKDENCLRKNRKSTIKDKQE